MKTLLIGLSFLMSFESAMAMEGTGKDVSRCVSNAINRAIFGKLKEKAHSLTTTTKANQIHRKTSIVMRWGEEEEITLLKKSVSQKKLNFILTEDEIIHGMKVVNNSYTNDYNDPVRTSLHVKKVNFELSTTADGEPKYSSEANLKNLVREYNNHGELESVKCSLVNAKIRSHKTQAILLKSE